MASGTGDFSPRTICCQHQDRIRRSSSSAKCAGSSFSAQEAKRALFICHATYCPHKTQFVVANSRGVQLAALFACHLTHTQQHKIQFSEPKCQGPEWLYHIYTTPQLQKHARTQTLSQQSNHSRQPQIRKTFSTYNQHSISYTRLYTQ